VIDEAVEFSFRFSYIAGMKCPSCSNQLRQVRSESAILDICPKCKGIWFDSGEFIGFVKHLANSELVHPCETKPFEHREVRALHSLKEKNRLCPRCAAVMKKFNYAADSNVFLDKCESCEGIWADGGEVKAVAEYIKDDPKATEFGRTIAESTGELCELAGEQAEFNFSRFLFFPRLIVPLSDDVPRERLPIVTVSLIALYALIFVAGVFFDQNKLAAILNFGLDDLFTVDLIVSMFSQGGFFHFIWTMLFLWLFGDNVEDQFSRLGYLFFWLCCGLFASLLYIIFNGNFSIVTALSGAVSGVMGAYFIFYPIARIRIFVIYNVMEIPAALCLGLWFLFQLISPFLSSGGVALSSICFAHAGGFILGAAIAFCKKGFIRQQQ